MDQDFVCVSKTSQIIATHALIIPTEATEITVHRYKTILGSNRYWCGDCESDIFLGDERFSKRCDERIAVFTIESTLYKIPRKKISPWFTFYEYFMTVV